MSRTDSTAGATTSSIGHRVGVMMSPGPEIARLPVAVAERLEEVVLAALHDDNGVGAGAIRDPLVQLLEVVSIVDVDRVGVRPLPWRLRGGVSGDEERMPTRFDALSRVRAGFSLRRKTAVTC